MQEKCTYTPYLLAGLSKRNRMFVDSLVRVIWCEVQTPFHLRKAEDRDVWLDLELPSYRSIRHSKAPQSGTGKSRVGHDTARDLLTKKEIQKLQEFIDTHYCATKYDAKKALSELVGDCIACALND